jgi:hypothetical protein
MTRSPEKTCRLAAIGHYEAAGWLGESVPTSKTGRRLGTALRTGVSVAALVCAGWVAAGHATPRHKAPTLALGKLINRGHLAVETVVFPGRPPVKIVRGGVAPRAAAPTASAPAKTHAAATQRTEVLSFGAAGRVTIVRGFGGAAAAVDADARRSIQIVGFADARLPAVTVVREWGASLPAPIVDWFAADSDLDRIAFSVDGIESQHGADLAMWRPEFTGPQGPMQISAAAAFDVGGGDRFDLQENRLLGRAYLAQMFHRYGNWPDALGAYNWGPANLDRWITLGRDPDQMPPGVAWYISRALHDATRASAVPGW